MRDSLKLRLTLISFFSLALLAGGVAYYLEKAFDTSLQAQLQERLRAQLMMLLTAAEEDVPGELFIPEVVREDAFNRIDSGYYAFVYDGAGNELWRSFSAIDLTLNLAQIDQTGEMTFTRRSIKDVDYFYFSYSVIWESFDDSEHYYQFVILQESHLLDSVVEDFRITLWSGLVLVLVIMAVIQLVALRWGLLPLRRIIQDLRGIESGKQKTFATNYPIELQPLTHNLNFLLETERQQREKYRNTLSNLAHSLKTPLAVIRGETQALSNRGQIISDQVTRMDEIIQYQLTRTLSGISGHMLSPVNVCFAINKIKQALEKVYSQKKITIELDCDEQARFFGDEGDLMEICGNIMDNACKFANSQVVIKVTQKGTTIGHSLIISIDDDGDGVSEEDRNTILQRGKRLDESTEGQGIGLSVVTEIVLNYGGEISIQDSELGGASFTLEFSFTRA